MLPMLNLVTGLEIIRGWVKGKFMLTISEQELEREAPKIIERKLQRKLGELFK